MAFLSVLKAAEEMLVLRQEGHVNILVAQIT
jgi:hypothetical protein